MDGAPHITEFDDLDGLIVALRLVVERLQAIDRSPAMEFWSEPSTGGAASLSSSELKVIWPDTLTHSPPHVRSSRQSTVPGSRRPVA